MQCQTISPSERLVLFVLLELTQGEVAEASQHQLAPLVGFGRRAISELLPQLARAGWFRVERRGSRPSILRWSNTGPLASAWTAPRLRGVPNAEKVAPPAPVTRSAPVGVRTLPLAQVERAIRELYLAHETAPRAFGRHHLRDVVGLQPEHHARVAEWLDELARQSGTTVRRAALAAMATWFRMPGSQGCLARAGHPLSMLCAGEGRDLHTIARTVLTRGRWYHEEDFAPTPAPALDSEEAARGFAEVARAAGGAR